MSSIFDPAKPIAIGSDHAGYEYKTSIINYLQQKGFTIKDHGTESVNSTDYPDFAHPTSVSVESGEAAFGILLCGSANGVAITANKHQGIRAAICWQKDIAVLTRLHNDANMLCLPARFVSLHYAYEIIDTFMATAFEGGRHATRVNKIACV